MDEAQSEIDSEQDVAEDDEYETVTISEAALNEQQYDQDFDMLEEKQAMEKLKGKIINFILHMYIKNNERHLKKRKQMRNFRMKWILHKT